MSNASCFKKPVTICKLALNSTRSEGKGRVKRHLTWSRWQEQTMKKLLANGEAALDAYKTFLARLKV